MTFLAGPVAQQRERNARLLAETAAIAAAHEALGVADDAASGLAPRNAPRDPPRALPVVLLPSNGRPMVPLPSPARAAFLAHLTEVLQEVFAQPLRDNTSPMTAEAAEARVSAGDIAGDAVNGALSPQMVGASCATCRGSCCTAGGTVAFLRADSLVRVRARLGEAVAPDASEIVQLYAQHLPARHYRNSCVYHTQVGCALPRDLRSNLCNRYQCGELATLQRALADANTGAAYVGAADSVRLRRVSRVDDTAAPVRLSVRRAS